MDGGIRLETDHYETLRVGFRRELAEAVKRQRLFDETGYDGHATWARIHREAAEDYKSKLEERGLHV